MKETRYYLIEHGTQGDKDLTSISNEEFMTIAENNGRVYTSKGFQQAFNDEEINSAIDELRVIEVEIQDPIEHAKKTLSEAGYYTENLWTIHDVKSKFKCTDKEAMQVLDISLNEDYTKETINETISNNGDAMGLTHKE